MDNLQSSEMLSEAEGLRLQIKQIKTRLDKIEEFLQEKNKIPDKTFEGLRCEDGEPIPFDHSEDTGEQNNG